MTPVSLAPNAPPLTAAGTRDKKPPLDAGPVYGGVYE
jgi:hypothetical protein